jgi:hypothetical protein
MFPVFNWAKVVHKILEISRLTFFHVREAKMKLRLCKSFLSFHQPFSKLRDKWKHQN